MLGKRRTRREFKLRTREEERPKVDVQSEEEKRIRISPPDRSKYPRLFDNWLIILVFALLIVFLIFILRWLTGAI